MTSNNSPSPKRQVTTGSAQGPYRHTHNDNVYIYCTVL